MKLAKKNIPILFFLKASEKFLGGKKEVLYKK